jgi:hypothetical protein
MKYRQFEDLPVWREAADLARMMFEFTSTDLFRRHPGLRDQLERAALSISNNIAEGFERGTTNELLAFLYIAVARLARFAPCCGFWIRGMLSAIANLKFQISDFAVRAFRSSYMVGLNNSRHPRFADSGTLMRRSAPRTPVAKSGTNFWTSFAVSLPNPAKSDSL